VNLTREIQLLYKAEAQFKIPAASVIYYLVDEVNRPLPDVFPCKAAFTQFQWPESGIVDYVHYWCRVDRGYESRNAR
jgi:hypothetical protein